MCAGSRFHAAQAIRNSEALISPRITSFIIVVAHLQTELPRHMVLAGIIVVAHLQTELPRHMVLAGICAGMLPVNSLLCKCVCKSPGSGGRARLSFRHTSCQTLKWFQICENTTIMTSKVRFNNKQNTHKTHNHQPKKRTFLSCRNARCDSCHLLGSNIYYRAR